nr:unnamed protein product [Callosobruchus analis]
MKVEMKSARKGLFTAPDHKPPQHRYIAAQTALSRPSVIPRKPTTTSRNKVCASSIILILKLP